MDLMAAYLVSLGKPAGNQGQGKHHLAAIEHFPVQEDDLLEDTM